MSETYEVITRVTRYIPREEMNRLDKAKLIEVVENEPLGHGAYQRVVRLPDGTFWRGRYDIEYLSCEPVEQVAETVTKYRSLNK